MNANLRAMFILMTITTLRDDIWVNSATKHWIASTGNTGTNSGLHKQPECTADTAKKGIASNDKGNKIGVQCCLKDGDDASRPSCYGRNVGATYKQAVTHCSAQSPPMRLCYRSEIESGIGRGKGCNFDAYHLWTKTACDPIMHWIASTSGATNDYGHHKQPECTLDTAKKGIASNDKGNKIGVQCCLKDGSAASRPNCYGSNVGATYNQAVAYCSAQSPSMRLCYKSEIESAIGRGTGCSFDAYHVWTGTACHKECDSNPVDETTKCIGHSNEICNLRYNQVSFPGTHNSGAYNLNRDGFWKWDWSRFASIACSFENHKYHLQDQLDRGIRWFDIDVCIHKNKLKTCHNGAYGEEIRTLFGYILKHLTSHRKDIITVSFVNDAGTDDKEGNKWQRAQKLAELLEERRKNQWCPRCIYPADKVTYSIKDMILHGRRLVIYVANQLIKMNSGLQKDWILNAQKGGEEGITDTWKDEFRVVASSRCGGLVERAEEVCKSPPEPDRSITMISLFGHSGLCLKEMAERCNDQMNEAVDACFDAYNDNNVEQTPNVLLIDRQDVGKDNIDTVIKALNNRNIAEFTQITDHNKGKSSTCTLTGTLKDYFRLQNKENFQCIDDNGKWETLGYGGCTNSEDRYWKMDRIRDGYFRLKNKKSDGCIAHIGSTGAAAAAVRPCTTHDNLYWTKVYDNDKVWFRLKNKETGECMYRNSDGRSGVGRCQQYSDQLWIAWDVSVDDTIVSVPDTDWKDNIGRYSKYLWSGVAILVAVNIFCVIYAKCRNGVDQIQYKSVSLQSCDDDSIA